MGARLRVFLTPEQNKTLLNLRTADVPQKGEQWEGFCEVGQKRWDYLSAIDYKL